MLAKPSQGQVVKALKERNLSQKFYLVEAIV
jgi:hypothetical protein